MKRLFLGFEISNQDKRQIEQWRIANNIKTAKNIPKENYHITLAFLGNVTDELSRQLLEQLNQMVMPKVTLTIVQLEYWSRPKILCLSTMQVPAALRQFVEHLWGLLAPFGFHNQYKNYTPHITLCRKASHLPQPNNPANFTLSFQQFCLFESRSTADGVHYIPVKRW